MVHARFTCDLAECIINVALKAANPRCSPSLPPTELFNSKAALVHLETKHTFFYSYGTVFLFRLTSFSILCFFV